MAWRQYRSAFRQMDYDMHRFAEDALRAFLDSPGGASRFWQPAADIHETDEGIVIKLEVPGVTTESLSVTLSGDGGRLTVSGSRSEEAAEREPRTSCHLLEIFYGPFERSFDLPEEITIDRDAITATLKAGFLTITLPRRNWEPGPARQIPIAVE